MFTSSNKISKEVNIPGGANQIFSGTVITGEVNSSSDIRIDGALNGTLVCKGKVVLGAAGKIEGNIICQTADISGSIKGNINVAELLSLKATAVIEGDITTAKLSIEPGANFTGSCSMGAVVKDIKNEQSTERKLKEKTA
ncbi:MAG: polymer-forming cytoskeletal protein [Bacteroidia bacterium]|nr:polymer-forming cytoskeletal protein [Bacteroidia bacterium]